MREIELRTSHATLSHSLRGVEQCQTRISTREIQKLHPSLGVESLRSYNGSCNENVTVKYKPLWLLKRPSTLFTLLKPESAPLETSVHHHLYISGQENHFFWSSHLQFAWLPPVDGGHLRAQLQAFGGFFPVLGSSSMIKTRVKNVNSTIRYSRQFCHLHRFKRLSYLLKKLGRKTIVLPGSAKRRSLHRSLFA